MIRESISRIITRLSDIAFHGRNKAMIIIGTDRKEGQDSGYGDGGENDPDSAVIDMVTGFAADQTNPNYQTDKSRIYIAEKTDPDDYFGINLGSPAEEEPSIVQISDNLYMKARNKIKILNNNVTINIDSDGNIEIESSEKAEIKVGTNKIVISSSGIELDAGQGISGKIITDLDQSVHIDPVTGGQVFANFQPPAIVLNSLVKIK